MKSYLTPLLKSAIKSLGVEREVQIALERPRNPDHGNLSTNVAMSLAKELKGNPRQIAQSIIDALEVDPQLLPKIELAGPGFINFSFSADFYTRRIAELAAKNRATLGANESGAGRKVNVEYLSANPTGLLHLGHGRNAALGDTIANILQWNGYEVTREYYFNNAGNQMRKLADSVYARYRQLLGEADFEFPADGYHGEYIRSIAEEIDRSYGNSLIEPTKSNMDTFRRCAEEWCFTRINDTVKRMGISHDIFFNEDGLYRDGSLEAILDYMFEQELVYKKDGAIWFALSKLGLSEDRPAVKSSGEPTYRLPDIAYHCDKLSRGFDRVIDILGADHAAEIPDVKAMVGALGLDSDKIEPIIYQFVTLSEDGQQVKMSKRSARMFTLDDLLEEVGTDVARFFFVMRNNNTPLDIDLDLAKDQTEKNPVLYLQYAHARISSLMRKAEEKGIELQKEVEWSLLQEEREINLIGQLLRFEEVIARAADVLEPVIITEYLRDAATEFHRFYHDCPILPAEAPLRNARLHLAELTRVVIHNGLQVLGISAPEKM